MTMTMTDTDRQIHQAVLREFQWDTQVNETEVGVEVDSGVVTLTGTVGSYAKKMAAQEAAHRVAGVRDVANDIKVHYAGSYPLTDTEIARAVRHALEWDALIADEKIQSTATKGWVTLEGRVPFLADRLSAEQAVRKLRGVRGVINNITVSPPEVNSEQVRRSIEETLERRAEREARRVSVEVADGTVQLTGKVHNWNEKQAILGAISHAPGVCKVEDRLRIDPSL